MNRAQRRGRRTVQRTAFAAVLGAASTGGVAITLATPVGASSVPSSTTLPPTSSTVFPGVTITSDGWIHYTPNHSQGASNGSSQGAPPSSISDTLGTSLVDPTIEHLVGKVNRTGSCVIRQTNSEVPGQSPVFSEEVAYNPITCQAQYEVGHLPAASTPSAPSHSTSAGTAMSAASSTIHKNAYIKSAFLDPFDITINSLATNLSWYINNPVSCVSFPSANIIPYKFAYDGWSTSGVSQFGPWKSSPTGCSNSVFLGGYDQFRNTDFEDVVVALLGIDGYAACGFTGAAATFTYTDSITGTKTGSFSTASTDTKQGGCTDLVHRDSETGYGSTS